MAEARASTSSTLGAGSRVLILGAGNFGTCLAHHLSGLGARVTLWDKDEAVVRGITQHHRNPRYLRDLELAPSVTASTTFVTPHAEAADAVVIALPTQVIRAVLSQHGSELPPSALLVCVSKGIETETLKLPSGIVADTLGSEAARRLVFLSGPSFAEEIARRLPTAVVAASRDVGNRRRTRALFHSPFFHVVPSGDPIGLEVAGALKNVIAICAGAATGLGYEMNSLAAVMTAGLAEIRRIGVALGARPLTFLGLGGIGDLFLTCSSPKSRNYQVGLRIGRGERLAPILTAVGSVAEGVATTKAAFRLARQLDVATPIIDEIHSVLYEDKPIADAVNDLLYGHTAKFDPITDP